MEADEFGKQLKKAGLERNLVSEWSVDPQVAIEPGTKGSIFDALEDLDSKECLEKLVKLSMLNAN